MINPYLESPSDPRKMVGHDPLILGNDPIFKGHGDSRYNNCPMNLAGLFDQPEAPSKRFFDGSRLSASFSFLQKAITLSGIRCKSMYLESL